MSEHGYVLRMWPSRLYAIPVALFTFLWMRFLWRWYALLLIAPGLSEGRHPRGFFLLFGLPFLMAGLSLVGTSLRLCFGRTTVGLDGLRLSVKDGLASGRAFSTPLVLPTVKIIDFVAETSACDDPEQQDERELDTWQVRARLDGGASVALPLPVRSLGEADDVASRLNRALGHLRRPQSYRDGVLL
jgi:hypothetical protein